MSAVEVFKSSVLRIRDILRGPGIAITGMDSMRHICIYLMCRYITQERAPQLDVPLEFAWENIIDLLRKDGGVQKALDIFNHPNVPIRIIDHFDRLFGTQGFSFDVKSILRHKEILEILDKVNIDAVDCHMDMLGWVYEQHLSTGAKAGRDLGQFFTNRPLCKYMTALCEPKFKAPNVPESVCDPTMGTGGFLTSYIKYYRENYPERPVNWANNACEIHGCDADIRVAGVARMNVFMETKGARAIDVIHHDSLYGGLSQNGYDIILANMPFGLKGIKYTDCCERIKKLKFNGTKSEPLFLQLIMQSLNKNGRCAVVVPDGVLIDNAKMQIQTRKHLITNFDLRKVVHTKGKMFMNTSITPCILYFANSESETTGDIEFSEIEKNASGEIIETPIATVYVDDLDQETFSLDIRKYLEPENKREVSYYGEYPTVTLGDLYQIPPKIKKFNSGDMSNTGDIPFYNGAWNCPIGMHNECSFDSPEDYFIVIKDGNGKHNSDKAGLGKFFDTRGKCAITSHNMILAQKNPNIITHRYIDYYMKICIETFRNRAKYAITKMQNIHVDDILTFPVILPPQNIQEQIVATIEIQLQKNPNCINDLVRLSSNIMNLLLRNPDGSTLIPIIEALDLSNNATRMIRAIKEQMRAILNSRVHDEPHKLSDICNMHLGKQLDIKQYTTEGLAVIKHKNIVDGKVVKSNDQNYVPITTSECHLRMNIGDIVISTAFDCGRCGYITEPNWIISCDTCLIRTQDEQRIRQRYLYWQLYLGRFYANMSQLKTGVTIKHIRKENIQNFQLLVPSIEIQDDIIHRLDDLQHTIESLQSLIRDSNSNARFILESYLSGSGRVEQSVLSTDCVPDEQEDSNGSIDPSAASSSGTFHGDTDDEDDTA